MEYVLMHIQTMVLGILTVDNLFSINLFMGMESASSSSSVLLLLIHTSQPEDLEHQRICLKTTNKECHG